MRPWDRDEEAERAFSNWCRWFFGFGGCLLVIACALIQPSGLPMTGIAPLEAMEEVESRVRGPAA